MSPLLEVSDLRVAYGRIEAVRGISFTVEAGQIVSLIGSNGAGKTTTLRTLSGLLRPVGGSIVFDGARLDGRPAHEVVARGLAHSPEGRRIFPFMTVEENLELGAFSLPERRKFASAAGAAAGDAGALSVRDQIDAVYERFPRLAERRAQKAGTMSGGEQQMLAMGRALMSRPRLLMLDEPSMGLSPIMMELIFTTIAELKAQGVTVLLVEQNAQAALGLADHGYVIETGRIALSGTGSSLLGNDDVRKAYLGED